MHFKYTAFTSQKQIVKGEIEVTDKELAIQTLERAGYNILTLKEFHKFSLEEMLPTLFRVQKAEVSLFSRQLAMLANKGVRFLFALQLATEQVKNRVFKKKLEAVIAEVEGGSSFSQAISKYPEIFPAMYMHMIMVGERSGQLDTVLRDVAADMERDDESKKKIRNAFIYPGVVLCVGIITLVIMVTTVLPSMKQIFARFDAELPLPTRILLGLGDFLSSYGLYLLVGLLVLTLVLLWYSRTPRGKYMFESLIMKLPVIGNIITLRSFHQFSKIITILLGAGLSIPEVISIAQQGVESEVIRRELQKIPAFLMQGYGLSGSMKESRLFPPMLVQMVVTGEETNTLDSSFQALSDHYEFEFDQALTTFMSLLEPVLVLLIGLVVGFVAISAILPMYSMYRVIF